MGIVEIPAVIRGLGAPTAALSPNTPRPPMAARTAETDGAKIGVPIGPGRLGVRGSGGGTLPGGAARWLDTMVWLMHPN